MRQVVNRELSLHLHFWSPICSGYSRVYFFSLNMKDIPDIIDLFIFCRYQGNVSAALVLGGYDTTGPHLHTVSCVSKSYLGWSLNIISLNSITSWSNICRFIPMALLILSHLQQWDLDPWLQWQCLNRDTKKTWRCVPTSSLKRSCKIA